MTEFGVLAIALMIASKMWNDSIDGNGRGDTVCAVLAILCGLLGTACLAIAVVTAPWGSVL